MRSKYNAQLVVFREDIWKLASDTNSVFYYTMIMELGYAIKPIYEDGYIKYDNGPIYSLDCVFVPKYAKELRKLIPDPTQNLLPAFRKHLYLELMMYPIDIDHIFAETLEYIRWFKREIDVPLKE
jgi:hypothetical protein